MAAATVSSAMNLTSRSAQRPAGGDRGQEQLAPAAFAFEQLDGRLRYSLPTLLCILLYSASVILSNVARGWSNEPRPVRPYSAGTPASFACATGLFMSSQNVDTADTSAKAASR